MSAYISFRYPDGIRLLSDGGAWDMNTGTLGATVDKVRRAAGCPLAIVGRGRQETVEKLQTVIINQADKARSVDDTLLWAVQLFARIADDERALPPFELLLAAFSETEGPKQYLVTNIPTGHSWPLYEFIDMEGVVCAGPAPSREQFAAICLAKGIAPADPRFIEVCGVDVMDVMRSMPADPRFIEEDSPAIYPVGGHVDFAEVTANGIRMRRLHVYGDKVGQPINPAVRPMNRHERRAAGRRAA